MSDGWDLSDFDEDPDPDLEAEPELVLPALHMMLGDLGNEVMRAQGRLVSTVESKQAELSVACREVGKLRGTIDRLKTDISTVSVFLEDSGEMASASPIVRVRCAAREHSTLTAELSARDAATEVIRKLLAMKAQMRDFDEMMESDRFVDAANTEAEIRRGLIALSSKGQEPRLVVDAKQEYYARRSTLVSNADGALHGLSEVRKCACRLLDFVHRDGFTWHLTGFSEASSYVRLRVWVKQLSFRCTLWNSASFWIR